MSDESNMLTSLMAVRFENAMLRAVEAAFVKKCGGVEAAKQEMEGQWGVDPVRFVREILGVEPEDWQIEALRTLGGWRE